MQDYELSLQHVLWRIERLHQKKEVVTKREQGVHRTTNGEMVPRINQLAGALKLERLYIVGHDIGGMVTYAFVRRLSAIHSGRDDPRCANSWD